MELLNDPELSVAIPYPSGRTVECACEFRDRFMIVLRRGKLVALTADTQP